MTSTPALLMATLPRFCVGVSMMTALIGEGLIPLVARDRDALSVARLQSIASPPAPLAGPWRGRRRARFSSGASQMAFVMNTLNGSSVYPSNGPHRTKPALS
jgi:hypothetical protein